MNATLELEVEGFRRWTEQIIEGISSPNAKRAVLRTMAFDFIGRVTKRTPVDTGRARGGWASYLVANGRAITPEGEGWAVGLAEGFFVESFRGREASIALVNGVPYIVFLEFGHSAQAPHGMVRITLREMRSKGVAAAAINAQLRKTIAQADRTARQRSLRRLPG